MIKSSRWIDRLVTLFVVTGIALSVYTALRVGRDMLDRSYPVLVHINDATGVVRGNTVRLGGVEVGRVSDQPYFKKDFSGVLVPLLIRESVKIPDNVIATVSDREIVMKLSFEPGEGFVREDGIINGYSIDRDEMMQKGMGESLATFQESMESFTRATARLDSLVTKLDDQWFTDNNRDSLNNGISHLEDSALKLFDNLDRVNTVLDSTDQSVKQFQSTAVTMEETLRKVDEMTLSGKESFELVQSMALQNQTTLDDFHLAIGEMRGLMGDVEPLLAQIEQGDGLLQALIHDECFSEDVRVITDRLRQYGFLFFPNEKRANPSGGIRTGYRSGVHGSKSYSR